MSRAEFTCTVVPTFIAEQSSPRDAVYAFAYQVTIVNTGEVTAQLIGREWEIQDADGKLETVRGLAVVGKQPILRPGERFEYSSWTRIATPTGAMRGHFYCVTEDVQIFEAPIPEFVLDAAAAGSDGASDSPADGTRVLH